MGAVGVKALCTHFSFYALIMALIAYQPLKPDKIMTLYEVYSFEIGK
jgi:hypothetical protein